MNTFMTAKGCWHDCNNEKLKNKNCYCVPDHYAVIIPILSESCEDVFIYNAGPKTQCIESMSYLLIWTVTQCQHFIK